MTSGASVDLTISLIGFQQLDLVQWFCGMVFWAGMIWFHDVMGRTETIYGWIFEAVLALRFLKRFMNAW